MALRQIRTVGDPVLTKTCKEIKEITPKILELADDMLETMYEANGVGLAAPQVGILKRMVVIDIGDGPILMINPEIIETSGTQTGDEGCLSLRVRQERLQDQIMYKPVHLMKMVMNMRLREQSF